ncbi:MAG: putative metal-binding motif-containing protein, partial [Deltaproteobacteria bacterium]|nr:putative metal-binding motif-containing protein [Deltaproteobacteria bacterium]
GYGAEKGGDCDDAAATVHPGAAELCNGADDDCDGAADAEGAEGCKVWWRDGDKDGYGDPGATKCLCAPVGTYTATGPGDCDDADSLVNSGGVEKCGNNKDDDCNGFVDEEGAGGCASYWLDDDKDLWGVGTPKCLCTALGTYSATKPGDCNDGNATINPGQKEVCANGVDDNCSGAADEEGAIGCKPHYLDGDGDKYGLTAVTKCLCAPGGGYVANGSDCDDTDPARNPGVTEKCATLFDDDCDGVANERNAVGCAVFYWDADEDGYGTTGRCYCQPTSNYTAPIPGDCNDSLNTVNPGAAETCNGRDDDCDAATDEENSVGCTDYYVDGDSDGWGSIVKKCLCAASGIYTTSKGGDCRDDDAAIHPGQSEICNGGRDDNCDGAADPEGTLGCQVWYLDADRDGWGDPGASKCLCLPSAGTYDASKGGDCLDADPAITGCRSFFLDVDGDGWGKDSDSKCLCSAIGNYRAVKGLDCDDALASVNPVAPETCNGRDDDCDAQADEEGAAGCAQWWQDLDGDGWGGAGPKCLCAATGFYKAPNGGDCLDSDPDVNPGRKEVCFPLDGKDNDCSGTADDHRLVRMVRLDYSDIDDPTAPSVLQSHLESLGYQVILESIPPKKLSAIADLPQVTFLWIHGHDAFSMPAAHRTLLADYVNGGGTLFADDGNPGVWGEASAFMTSFL